MGPRHRHERAIHVPLVQTALSEILVCRSLLDNDAALGTLGKTARQRRESQEAFLHRSICLLRLSLHASLATQELERQPSNLRPSNDGRRPPMSLHLSLPKDPPLPGRVALPSLSILNQPAGWRSAGRGGGRGARGGEAEACPCAGAARGSLLITSQLPLATWHEVVLHFATA
jgi:hypothetical protein